VCMDDGGKRVVLMIPTFTAVNQARHSSSSDTSGVFSSPGDTLTLLNAT